LIRFQRGVLLLEINFKILLNEKISNHVIPNPEGSGWAIFKSQMNILLTDLSLRSK